MMPSTGPESYQRSAAAGSVPLATITRLSVRARVRRRIGLLQRYCPKRSRVATYYPAHRREIDSMTELAVTPRYPVAMTLSPPEDSSRLWAVPLFGFLVKCLILI